MSNKTRSKASFKALRERVGLSQQDVSNAIGVNYKTEKRWENPNFKYGAPEDAWEYLEKVAETQKQQVSYCLGVIAHKVEEYGQEPVCVPITYYRDQKMYDEYGRDEGPYGWPNAVSRMVAYELERRGIEYEFRYPTEGAISTEGSNY